MASLNNAELVICFLLSLMPDVTFFMSVRHVVAQLYIFLFFVFSLLLHRRTSFALIFVLVSECVLYACQGGDFLSFLVLK